MSIKVSCSVIGMSILLAACGPNESHDTSSKELLDKQTPITKDNWVSHSTIVEAKTIVRKAESALKERSLEVLKTSEKPYDDEIWSWERHLDEDKTVLIVERWRGSIRGNDGSWEGRNYYNQDGKLVFTDFSFQSEYVDRENWDWSATLYFDPTDESLSWITYKQLTPPNFPGNNSSSWREKELTASEYRWDLLPFPFDLVDTYRCSAVEDSIPNEDEYVIKSNAVDLVNCNEEDAVSALEGQPEAAHGECGLFGFVWDRACWYRSTSRAMHTNEEYFKQAPKEVAQDIFDRWLNIDEGYLERHPHWHKEDRSDITFENFTNAFYFFPADSKFSMATAICNKRENYNEIVLVTELGKWFDLNQGRADKYSVSLWEWYNTVAIRSGSEEFIDHSKPFVYRWNAPISKILADEILRTGRFEIYVESNQYRSMGIMMDKERKEENKVFPNLNLKANVTITNINEVRGCFYSDTQKTL